MTIAIGVACPAGVILISDSMIRTSTTAGVVGEIDGRDRIKVRPEARGVYLVSGTVPVGWEPELSAADDAGALAQELFTQHAPHARSVTGFDFDGNFSAVGPLTYVLAAYIPRDGAIQLAMAAGDTIDHVTRIVPLEGAVMVGGAPAVWAQENSIEAEPAPSTLDGCVEHGLSIARRYMDFQTSGKTLDDYSALGLIPAAWPPFQVATITPAEIRTFEVSK